MLLLTLCIFSVGSVLCRSTNVGIINGTDGDISDYPWMVSIYDENDFTCGGSLISPDWVLTAGHCAQDKNIEKIRIGSSNLKDDIGTFVGVTKVIIHPNFTRVNGAPLNDLTLLHLEYSVGGTNIAPIGLPLANTPILEKDSITITGWGDTTGLNRSPDTLQVVTIEIPSLTECQNAYSKYGYIVDKKGEFCAGIIGDSKGTCRGDSGGPAEINGTIFGIVSWGYQACATSGMPVVLVNVPTYVEWILNVTGIKL